MKFLRKDKNLIEHYRKSAAFTAFDLVLVALIVFAVTVCAGALSPTEKEDAAFAYVYIDGKEAGRYSLESDREIPLLDGRVTLTVSDGAVAITENDCPNGICLKTGYISKAGERIVCVPNKISVVLRADDGSSGIYVTGGGGS